MGLFGNALLEAINSSGEDVEMLIEGILASQSTTQFFAGDGLGKSTLLLQMELQASAGVPIFGEYEVKRPLKVVHIQTERSPREAYQRMIMMMQKIPVNFDNFYFESTLQGFDIGNLKDREAITERLQWVRDEFGGVIDWIHIDPIYAWTSKDLSGSDGAGSMNDMLRKIQKDVCQTVSYNHHPNRGVRDQATGKRGNEDMYGNRFISANCTGVFQIHPKPGGGGTIWNRIKDSYSCLTQKIELEYEAQHYMSYVDTQKSFATKTDRMVSFLKVCKSKKKVFSFEEFMAENDVSTAYARRQISRYMELGFISVSKINGKKHLYESTLG
jgi:RecA-family ATPase